MPDDKIEDQIFPEDETVEDASPTREPLVLPPFKTLTTNNKYALSVIKQTASDLARATDRQLFRQPVTTRLRAKFFWR